MRLKSLHLRDFRRFKDLRIEGLSPEVRLVVMVGPNGMGKSSVFDAFNAWRRSRMNRGSSQNEIDYYSRLSEELKYGYDLWSRNSIEFFSDTSPNELPFTTFYIRSAYRNDPDVNVTGFSRIGLLQDRPILQRLIDNDASVSLNYQLLVSNAIESLFGPDFEEVIGRDIRDHLIGKVRESMSNIFPNLQLDGPGNPMIDGTFRFSKEDQNNFHYKNLSGGEKATFDLLLDFVVKSTEFQDSIYCIDEPETHINTKVQASLLNELYRIAGPANQL